MGPKDCDLSLWKVEVLETRAKKKKRDDLLRKRGESRSNKGPLAAVLPSGDVDV